MFFCVCVAFFFFADINCKNRLRYLYYCIFKNVFYILVHFIFVYMYKLLFNAIECFQRL